MLTVTSRFTRIMGDEGYDEEGVGSQFRVCHQMRCVSRKATLPPTAVFLFLNSPQESRLGLVARQLARSPYLAGETFTAADISVTYALELARRSGGVALGETEQAYVARTSGRGAYKRAMETCQATRAWAAEASGQ